MFVFIHYRAFRAHHDSIHLPRRHILVFRGWSDSINCQVEAESCRPMQCVARVAPLAWSSGSNGGGTMRWCSEARAGQGQAALPESAPEVPR